MKYSLKNKDLKKMNDREAIPLRTVMKKTLMYLYSKGVIPKPKKGDSQGTAKFDTAKFGRDTWE